MARLNGQPAHAVDIVALCLQYVGVEPTLVEQYDRSKVRMQDRVQGRIDANNAPKHMVELYARQMSESRFPAPLVTKDNIPVDGNTRFKAYLLNRTRYIECWQLPIEWDGADQATKDKLLLLSLHLNSMNGLPLDPVELLKYAETLMRYGASDEEISGKTGLSPSKVSSLRDQKRAAERLTHLGHEVNELKLADTSLRALGKPNSMRLDDDAYNGLLQLSRDAQLKGNQINQIATSLNEATSPESRRDRLTHERRALNDQIEAIRHGQLHPNLTDWMRKVIDKVLNHQITSFIENNPENSAEYAELLERFADRLAEIRTLQAGGPAAAMPLGRDATVQ